MKKFLSLLMVAGLVSGFSACDWCGSSCSKTTDAATQTAPAATTDASDDLSDVDASTAADAADAADAE
jgi:hypothetical protein